MQSPCQQAGPHRIWCPILNIPPYLQDHELNKSFPYWLLNLRYSVTATEHELRNGKPEDRLAVLCFHVWQMVLLGSENFFRPEGIIENKEEFICWSVYGETVPRVMSCRWRRQHWRYRDADQRSCTIVLGLRVHSPGCCRSLLICLPREPIQPVENGWLC